MKNHINWIHHLLLALVVATGTTQVHSAADDALVYPRFECYSANSPSSYTFYFSAVSFKTTDALPAINFFEPSRFNPPLTFKPGYNPRVMSVTLDPTTEPKLIWFLGDGDAVVVDIPLLTTQQRCDASTSLPMSISQCRNVTATAPPDQLASSATASCDAGEYLLNGGGSCQRGRLAGSTPGTNQDWTVTCTPVKRARATASITCCPL